MKAEKKSEIYDGSNKKILDSFIALQSAILYKNWTEDSLLSLLAQKNYQLRHIDDVAFLLVSLIPPEAEILTLLVAPEKQNQSYGLALWDDFLSYCHEQSITDIYLEVAANNHKAQRFYKKRGFFETGRRTDYYTIKEQKIDAILMGYKNIA